MATGPTHAASGLLTWAGVSLALTSAGIGTATMHGAMSPQTWTVGAVLATGAALLPDLDHPESTIARTFGPLTHLISRGTHEVSHLVYRGTRTRRDANRHGGHRGVTHTLVFAALAGLATLALVRASHQWALAVLLFTFCGLALRGLLHEWTPRGHVVGVTLVSAALTGLCWHWLSGAPGQAELAGIAVITGCLAHCLGDAITEQGCPILWPVPLGGKTWFPIAPPKVMRMQTGGKVELSVVGPLFTVLAVWLSAAALQVLGALPFLGSFRLLPW
jgi:membrane-bound metal-dependent hydrolase YbcI (DUF457 family)